MTALDTETCRPTTNAAPSENWRFRSACRDEDPELFFPFREDGPWAAQVEKAKKVCGRCPVRMECLESALKSRVDHGVAGGLSESERRRLHRRSRRYDSREPGMPEQIIKHRLAEFQAAVAAGGGVGKIARALGTNVQTVNTVLALLDTQAAQLDAASEAVA